MDLIRGLFLITDVKSGTRFYSSLCLFSLALKLIYKGNYDSTPQKHLLRGRCIHMYMEHKNHPDLRQTCRYEARKCQVSRNHHQS